MAQAKLLGISKTKAQFFCGRQFVISWMLWIVRRSGREVHYASSILTKIPRIKHLLTEGKVPWEDQNLKVKQLPGWRG